MKMVLYFNMPSPHQFPLAMELARIFGLVNVCFVYEEIMPERRKRMGWVLENAKDLTTIALSDLRARNWLESADFMLTGIRNLGLFERRGVRGLKTFYTSERWFKPAFGRLRLLYPPFLNMASHFVALVKKGYVTYLPCGVWAARDMAGLCTRGEERRNVFESLNRHSTWQPMEPIGCDWMRMWGYFVAPSNAARAKQTDANPRRVLRVLWVGRLLALKKVDTLFKAAAACLEKFPMELTVVGDGPERGSLERLGGRLFARHPEALDFRHSVPIGEVRALMRSHDVFVLPSNGHEGWGCVVNEALEEGMIVLGTRQTGSCATMLDEKCLFDEGDVQALSRLLEKSRSKFGVGRIGVWSAASGAARLLKEVMSNG